MTRDRVTLSQILERIQLAIEFAGDDVDEFFANRMRQEAVIRQLEVVGEAAKRISPGTRSGHDRIPWKGMAGFKDVAIHQYDSIDLGAVWDIVQRQLPKLRTPIRGALARLDDES